jgi:hypothetical protein
MSIRHDRQRIDAGLPCDFHSHPRKGKRDQVWRFPAGVLTQAPPVRAPALNVATHPDRKPARGPARLMLRPDR